MIFASKIAMAALGLLLIAGGDAATAQTRTTTRGCFTDDGYGRVRSCSQNFKKANPKWRTSASNKRKAKKL